MFPRCPPDGESYATRDLMDRAKGSMMLQYGHIVPAPGPHIQWPPALAPATGDLTRARTTALGRVDHFAPGTTLYTDGDVGGVVYWVVTGMVRTVKVGRDGNRWLRLEVRASSVVSRWQGERTALISCRFGG